MLMAPTHPSVAARPGTPAAAIALPKLDAATCSLPAPDIGSGSGAPTEGHNDMLFGVACRAPKFLPLMTALAMNDVSPKLGARKLLPHAPLMVKSSIGE